MNINNIINQNADFVEKLFKTVKPTGSRSVVAFYEFSTNQFHPVDLYRHVEWLAERYPWVKEELDAFNDYLDDEAYQFTAHLEPDEHPGWHNYEIWASNETTDKHHSIMFDAAQREGVVRVGFFRRSMEVGPARLTDEQKKIFTKVANELRFEIRFTQ